MAIINRDLWVDERYTSIADMFQPCLDQIQKGKGMERHGTDQKFKDQVTWQIIKSCPGFALGQMLKKGLEISRLSNTDAKIRELKGAINYGMFELMRLLEVKENEDKE